MQQKGLQLSDFTEAPKNSAVCTKVQQTCWLKTKRCFNKSWNNKCCNKRKRKLNTCRASSLSTKAYQKFRGPASENLELDQKLKEKLKHLKTQKLQNLMTLNRKCHSLAECFKTLQTVLLIPYPSSLTYLSGLVVFQTAGKPLL